MKKHKIAKDLDKEIKHPKIQTQNKPKTIKSGLLPNTTRGWDYFQKRNGKFASNIKQKN